MNRLLVLLVLLLGCPIFCGAVVITEDSQTVPLQSIVGYLPGGAPSAELSGNVEVNLLGADLLRVSISSSVVMLPGTDINPFRRNRWEIDLATRLEKSQIRRIVKTCDGTVGVYEWLGTSWQLKPSAQVECTGTTFTVHLDTFWSGYHFTPATPLFGNIIIVASEGELVLNGVSDNAGSFVPFVVTDGVKRVRINELATLRDHTMVKITGCVTYASNGVVFIADPLSQRGIALVLPVNVLAHLGDLFEVTGRLQTASRGVREIQVITIHEQLPAKPLLLPIIMSKSALGGAVIGFNPGLSSFGINTVGCYVQVDGWVTAGKLKTSLNDLDGITVESASGNNPDGFRIVVGVVDIKIDNGRRTVVLRTE